MSYIYHREVSKQVQMNDIAWKEIEAHGMSWNAMEPWTLDGNQCSCDIMPHDSNLNKRSRDLMECRNSDKIRKKRKDKIR